MSKYIRLLLLVLIALISCISIIQAFVVHPTVASTSSSRRWQHKNHQIQSHNNLFRSSEYLRFLWKDRHSSSITTATSTFNLKPLLFTIQNIFVKLYQFIIREKMSILTASTTAAVLSGTAFVALARWAKRRYKIISQDYPVDIDKYVSSKPTLMEMIQCALLRRYILKTRDVNDKPYKIAVDEANDLKGLQVTRRAHEGEESAAQKAQGKWKKAPLIIGSIRMGFGHHRLGYGAAAWALEKVGKERQVFFHDILNVKSEESALVDDIETLYSYGSRLASEMPKTVENALSSATGSGGNANALRMQGQTAALMKSLVSDLDLNSPFVATHPLVGCIAIAAGFKNVVNLVVDNHPQWFCIVPGALNLVQGPSLYQELLKMGIPENEIELVGHWCPEEMVKNIPEATRRRIQRKRDNKPVRLLIPVGGAGAQESLLCEIIDKCAPLVKEGKVQLFLNAGDHDHIEDAFKEKLDEAKLDFEIVTDIEGLNKFRDHLWASESNEPKKGVTLFSYSDKYPAVATTDKLCDVADVLVSKPSEMAFWAVPKLMIRRVGDHEQKSAYRAAELGDGTLEARTIDDIYRHVDEIINKPSVLINMNKAIKNNNDIGIYDGSKNAIERILQRADVASVQRSPALVQ